MTTDSHTYVIEQKVEDDFLRERVFFNKKDRYIKRNLQNKNIDFLTLSKSISKDLLYEYKSFSLKFPSELKYLENSFKKSEYILLLEDDWDDNDSPRYNYTTWEKSLRFITEYAKMLLIDFNKKIEPPKIYHGPKGSIDILIENSNYSLLINVLDDSNNKAIYFGKDSFGNTTKGDINLVKLNNNLIPLAFNF